MQPQIDAIQQQKIDRLLAWILASPKSFKHPCVRLCHFGSAALGFGAVIDHSVASGAASEASQAQNTQDMLRIDLDMFALNYKRAISSSDFGKAFLRIILNKKTRPLFADWLSELENQENGQSSNNSDGGAENFSMHAVLFYLFLIHEKSRGAASNWYPYLSMLPQSLSYMSNIALLFEDDNDAPDGDKLLSELQGSNLLLSIRSIRAKLCRIHATLFPTLTQLDKDHFPKEVFSLQEFIWAYAVVWSRVFPIADRASGEIVPTLLPLIDILNHERGTKVTYFTNVEEHTFALQSQVPISELQQGSALCNNYGAKSNDSFLLAYGFTIEDNPQDTYFVQIGFYSEEDSALSQLQASLLEQYEVPLGHYLGTTPETCLPEKLLSALRICHLNEFEAFSLDIASEETLLHPLSVRNECATLRKLDELLSARLAKLKGSLEDDEKIMARYRSGELKLSFNMKNVVVYRLGQKRILTAAISALRQRQNTFLADLRTQWRLPSLTIRTEEDRKTLIESDELTSFLNLVQNSPAVELVKLVPAARTTGALSEYALVAKRDLNAQDTILSFDKSQVPSAKQIKGSTFGQMLQKALLDEPSDEQLLILFLVYARFGNLLGKDAEFADLKPFIFTLEGVPSILCAERAELANAGVGVTSLVQQYEQMHDTLKMDHNEMTVQLSLNKPFVGRYGLESFRYEHMVWATVIATLLQSSLSSGDLVILPMPCVAIARSSFLQVIEDAHGCIIVKNLVNGIQAGEVLRLERQDLEAQQQLTDDLLLYHGCLHSSNNLHCIVSIDDLLEDMSEELVDEKAILVQFLNLGGEQYLTKERPPSKLMDMLRICFMTKEEAVEAVQRLDMTDDGADASAVAANLLQTEAELEAVQYAMTKISTVLNSLQESKSEDQGQNEEMGVKETSLRLSLLRQHRDALIEILESNLESIS